MFKERRLISGDQKLHGINLSSLADITPLETEYNEDKCLLNDSNLYEVSYEKLIVDPLITIRGIYKYLDLPGFANAERSIAAQITKAKKIYSFGT